MRFCGSICLTLLLLSSCVHLAAQVVTPVASSETRDVVSAFSAAGAVTLPVAHLLVDIIYPGGKTERGDLFVVSDPEGGHHFWRYRTLNSPGDKDSWLRVFKSGLAGIYAEHDRLVELTGHLEVEEHTGQSNGLDAAAGASISEILSRLPSMSGYRGEAGFRTRTVLIPLFGGGTTLSGFKVANPLSTFKPIPREFTCAPPGARDFSGSQCNSLTTIMSIGKQGSNWRIVLRNRWDQQVILDSNFDPISTQELTPAPSP